VRYDDIARKLVHALKYGDRLDLAPTMGRWMARAGRELLADSDAIVPVPLHWRRQWARRFNQSALLTEIIAKASGRMVAHGALKRRRPSRSGSTSPSALTTSRAPFACRPMAKPRLRGEDSCWSTTCSPRARPPTPARGHCCAPARRPSTFWYAPGLWRRGAFPYKKS